MAPPVLHPLASLRACFQMIELRMCLRLAQPLILDVLDEAVRQGVC
jgi:hypothetical protein